MTGKIFNFEKMIKTRTRNVLLEHAIVLRIQGRRSYRVQEQCYKSGPRNKPAKTNFSAEFLRPQSIVVESRNLNNPVHVSLELAADFLGPIKFWNSA